MEDDQMVQEEIAAPQTAGEAAQTTPDVPRAEEVRPPDEGKGDGEQQVADAPTTGSDEWYEQDSAAFAAAYPDLDVRSLVTDPDFLDYADGKIGRMPMAEVYEGYQRMTHRLHERYRVQNARAGSPGSLRQSAEDAEREYYTLAEMQGMSSRFIEQHWDKVQRSLKRLK